MVKSHTELLQKWLHYLQIMDLE